MNSEEEYKELWSEVKDDASYYMAVAKSKLWHAKKSLYYSAYQLENARWRISEDVYQAIVKQVILFEGEDRLVTLLGLPVDIYQGKKGLQLYVEI